MNNIHLSILGSAPFSNILNELEFNNVLNQNNLSNNSDKKILVEIIISQFEILDSQPAIMRKKTYQRCHYRLHLNH